MNVGTLFTVIAALVLPISAAIWMSAKKKGYLKPVLFGALTFVVFQICLRLPLLAYVLPNAGWFIVMSSSKPYIYALFLGATAALVEEGGRYAVMKIFLKNRRRVSDGIAFGIGHGGIEAVLLVGINALYALIISYADVPSGDMFAAGAERISAMIFHVAWSVMVLKSVSERKLIWLLIAFLLHTVVDAGAVIANYLGYTVFTIEVCFGGIALLMLLYIADTFNKSKGCDNGEKIS